MDSFICPCPLQHACHRILRLGCHPLARFTHRQTQLPAERDWSRNQENLNKTFPGTVPVRYWPRRLTDTSQSTGGHVLVPGLSRPGRKGPPLVVGPSGPWAKKPGRPATQKSSLGRTRQKLNKHRVFTINGTLACVVHGGDRTERALRKGVSATLRKTKQNKPIQI